MTSVPERCTEKLEEFVPNTPTLIFAWVDSVKELARTTLRGPLEARNRDFWPCHTSKNIHLSSWRS